MYGKRSNRRSRRKGTRRTLSNYHIATRISARSQAKQIYAIKKRINRIQKLTRPETKIITQALPIYTNVTSNFMTLTPQMPLSPPTTSNSSTIDPNSEPINVNRFFRLNTFHLYGEVRYDTITATVSPVNFRIVIVQQTKSRGDALNINDIFQGLGTTDTTVSGARGMANYGPLQTGLSRTCKVLSDKKYTLSYQRPTVKINTTLRYLRNLYWDTNALTSTSSTSQTTSDTYPSGKIYVFGAFDVQTSPAITGVFYSKLAFTDA